MPSREDVTRLLADLSKGKEGAGEALLPLVYDELHALAKRHMHHERIDHTLQTTALLHEAYLRLGGGEKVAWRNKAHFMKVAARAMRRILIDHARSKRSEIKGGNLVRKSLNEDDAMAVNDSQIDLLALDDILKELAEVDSRIVQVVELRYFAGLSVDETAEVLGISPRTVMYEWKMAKAWLTDKIR